MFLGSCRRALRQVSSEIKDWKTALNLYSILGMPLTNMTLTPKLLPRDVATYSLAADALVGGIVHRFE